MQLIAPALSTPPGVLLNAHCACAACETSASARPEVAPSKTVRSSCERAHHTFVDGNIECPPALSIRVVDRPTLTSSACNAHVRSETCGDLGQVCFRYHTHPGPAGLSACSERRQQRRQVFPVRPPPADRTRVERTAHLRGAEIG